MFIKEYKVGEDGVSFIGCLTTDLHLGVQI